MLSRIHYLNSKTFIQKYKYIVVVFPLLPVVAGNAAFYWVAPIFEAVDFYSASMLAHSLTTHGKEKTKPLTNQLWIYF